MKRLRNGDSGSNPAVSEGVSESDSERQVKRPVTNANALIETHILPVVDTMNGIIQQLTSNSLDQIGQIKSISRQVIELWVQWLTPRIKIQADGGVNVYAEFYLPGWLLLQIGRSLWPDVNDVRADGRRTSVSLLGLLRAAPDNGYLVDRTSFFNWVHITCYDGEHILARHKWLLADEEIVDESCYQVLTPGQVQPGLTKVPDMRCWVEIPDIAIPIPLYDFFIEI